MADFRQTNVNHDALIGALTQYSPFAADTLAAHPDIARWLRESLLAPYAPPQWLARELRSADDLNVALRLRRRRAMLLTMVRDVGGLASHAEVVHTVTALAVESLRVATQFHEAALRREFGTPHSAQDRSMQSLITVGMGKLGGEELNVSSDVDLIFLYPDSGETNARGKRLDNSEFFAKLAQRVALALSDVTADGFVFRVDTRLRPYGDEGPLAVPLEFLETYLVEQGRFWERLAWLRSASITGDGAACKSLSSIVRPFVYRRYLDYDAYEGLRELHGKIRAEGHRSGGDRNVKLGRGGIRELEFFVQVQQLVRGGREPSLQLRSTLPAIASLQKAGIFSTEQSKKLAEAYPFLRRVEHFLQYREDAQTQTLPAAASDLQALAKALGYGSTDEFMTALDTVRTYVAAQFDNLAQKSESVSPAPTTMPDATLFAEWNEGEDAERYLHALKSSGRFAALPPASRARLEALLPKVVRACAASDQPLAALKRWGDLLEAIAGRSAYLALLAEHEALLTPITRVLAASAWAAEFLRDHPILLDELLDTRARTADFDISAWHADLAAKLAATDDTEGKLNALRHFQQSTLFDVLLADLGGALTVERLSDQLSALADVVVEQTLRAVWQEISPGSAFPSFAVIAYGRWGGKELGYGSDLDLVFLIADDAPVDKLAKLAQRTQTWLTTATTAGRLYEVDTRLRPDGAAGLLLSTLSAFEDYQRNKAWRWEHQALSRARFAAGDAAVGAAFETFRKNLLKMPKSAPEVRKDIAEMRERMRAEKAAKTRGFDVKNDAGGMVDIEFIVQYFVLAFSDHHAFLIENKGNIALLHYAGEHGLLDSKQAEMLANAYRAYRAYQHHERLAGNDAAIVHDARFDAERSAVRTVWDLIFK